MLFSRWGFCVVKCNVLNAVYKVFNDFERFYEAALKDIGDGFYYYFFHVRLQPVHLQREGHESNERQSFLCSFVSNYESAEQHRVFLHRSRGPQ